MFSCLLYLCTLCLTAQTSECSTEYCYHGHQECCHWKQSTCPSLVTLGRSGVWVRVSGSGPHQKSWALTAVPSQGADGGPASRALLFTSTVNAGVKRPYLLFHLLTWYLRQQVMLQWGTNCKQGRKGPVCLVLSVKWARVFIRLPAEWERWPEIGPSLSSMGGCGGSQG